jgi:hypothetical protein
MVYGRRWWLSQDPAVAAEQLAQLLGGSRAAQRWAAELLAAFERRAV